MFQSLCFFVCYSCAYGSRPKAGTCYFSAASTVIREMRHNRKGQNSLRRKCTEPPFEVGIYPYPQHALKDSICAVVWVDPTGTKQAPGRS